MCFLTHECGVADKSGKPIINASVNSRLGVKPRWNSRARKIEVKVSWLETWIFPLSTYIMCFSICVHVLCTPFRSGMQKMQRCVCVFVCGKDVALTTQGQPGVKGSLTHSCWSLISIEWHVSSLTSSIWTAHAWPWTCGEWLSILRIKQVSNICSLQGSSTFFVTPVTECLILILT